MVWYGMEVKGEGNCGDGGQSRGVRREMGQNRQIQVCSCGARSCTRTKEHWSSPKARRPGAGARP